jgi:hypothetical protein
VDEPYYLDVLEVRLYLASFYSDPFYPDFDSFDQK